MEEFVGKRILMLGKETYSYPLFFLGNKWSEHNEVGIYFFNPAECMYNKCLLNDTTYYHFKENGKFQVFTSQDITEVFMQLPKNEFYQKEYLQEIEEKYTHFKNVNLQIMSTQFLTRVYHFRNYMRNCTYEQQMNWLVLNYKRAIEVMDEFRPDMIIDCDNSELARTVVAELAYAENIPYITIDYPRYDMYKTYTYNLGVQIGDKFRNTYNGMMDKSEKDLEEEISYILEYRKKNSIMSKEFQFNNTSNYKADDWFTIAKRLLGKWNYFVVDQDIKGKNKKLKKKCPLLFPDTREYLKFYLHLEVLRKRLMEKNTIFEEPVFGESYVYMPLHLIPESTTSVYTPFYVNELSIIEAVSKALPAGWKLYVKEHQAMLGERTLEFYKKVKKIPNVRLVQPNYYSDPKPWMQNAKGVITLAGTSAYEAALLGKQSIVWGDVPFSLIEGVTRVYSVEELPAKIKEFENIVDNQKSCAAYIATVKQLGEPVNIQYLMSVGEKIIRGQAQMDENYKKELESLERLYQKAYAAWKDAERRKI